MSENETKISENKKGVQVNKLSIPSAIIVAGLIIAGAVFFATGSSNKFKPNNNNRAQVAGRQQPQRQQPTKQAVDISKVDIKGEPFIGNPNAPVTIAYWSDYQCPFCKRFEEGALTQVIKNYVNTGKVKIVFKDFQFLGPDSQTAGLAARAVWEVAPNKFYLFHKAMYDRQDEENSGWGNKADILKLIKGLGINSVKVGQLMTNNANEYQQEMSADRAEGSSFGINGTPGVIIGNNIIAGAQPYSAVKQLIDLQLQGK